MNLSIGSDDRSASKPAAFYAFKLIEPALLLLEEKNMKSLATSLAVAATVLSASVAAAADKILLKTPIAFSTALPGLGSPIPRVAEQLDLMSGGTLKMKVYEPNKLCPSSYKMEHQSGLSIGGSGSFV